MLSAKFAQFSLAVTLGILVAAVSAEEESSTATEDAPEALLKPWNDAVDKFSKSQESARQALIRQLDMAEDKARNAGDVDKVNLLKAEQAAFVKDGKLPTSIKIAAYEKTLENASQTLRAAAKRTKSVLLRQKFDAAAETVDRQLDELAGGEIAKPHFAGGEKWPQDGRTYWKTKSEKGSEFRQISRREWVESTLDNTRKNYLLKEVSRTPAYVELFDPERKIGKRLRRETSEVSADYRELKQNEFNPWKEGEWIVDSDDVVYLSDLQEMAHKTWDYLGKKDWGWGKNGKLCDELIYLDNRPSPKGIFMHPQGEDFAMAIWNISPLKKKFFRAKFGISDVRRMNPASTLKFVVIGDGKRLFTSKPIKNWGEAHDCEVNIRGVQELELRIECAGNASLAYAVWFEPKLTDK